MCMGIVEHGLWNTDHIFVRLVCSCAAIFLGSYRMPYEEIRRVIVEVDEEHLTDSMIQVCIGNEIICNKLYFGSSCPIYPCIVLFLGRNDIDCLKVSHLCLQVFVRCNIVWRNLNCSLLCISYSLIIEIKERP